jgi:hypothetical protein
LIELVTRERWSRLLPLEGPIGISEGPGESQGWNRSTEESGRAQIQTTGPPPKAWGEEVHRLTGRDSEGGLAEFPGAACRQSAVDLILMWLDHILFDTFPECSEVDRIEKRIRFLWRRGRVFQKDRG